MAAQIKDELPEAAHGHMDVSTDIVINVEHLSKAYTIWSSPAARLHGPLLGQIGQMTFLPNPTRRLCQRMSHQSFRNFWALKGVSFQVARGECVGIIGRNGSGKSTLLQVVAGTLEPTEGRVTTQGRVAALLELGSGFNPEFTGRENVFLNAAVLGLSRQETEAKFGEIESFADIGDFIDQPTKTYSSGMVVRLAFAVQATVNPDILIVDEALAVGDEAFQRKCYARIETIRKNGGTVLFVTHSTGIVVQMCQRALLIDRGELLLQGPPKPVVAKYHKLLFAPRASVEAIRKEIRSASALDGSDPVPVSTSPGPDAQETYEPGMTPKSTVSFESRGAFIESPRVITPSGRVVNGLVRGREYIYTYRVRFREPAQQVRFGMMIKNVAGFEIGGAVSHLAASAIEHVDAQQVATVRFRFRCLLRTGTYFLNAGVLGAQSGEEVYLHRLLDVAMFRVLPEKTDLSTGATDLCIAASAEFAPENALAGVERER